MKHNETNYLGKFKWGRNNKTTIPENPHMQIMDSLLLCPKPYFKFVKQENNVDHVNLGIFPPHLHIKFIKIGATVNQLWNKPF